MTTIDKSAILVSVWILAKLKDNCKLQFAIITKNKLANVQLKFAYEF